MMVEIIDQEIEGELFSFQAMFSQDDDSLMQDNGLLAYKEKADPDTMYIHEALKEPDREKFIEAMEKEITQQVQRGVYSIIKKSKLPQGAMNCLQCGHCNVNETSELVPSRNTKHVAISTAHE
jgi:ferredoxin-like protein FixX